MKKMIVAAVAALFPAVAFADQPTASQPVAVDSGTAILSPSNSLIHFIGTHEGSKPDPRKGGFAKFIGEAKVNTSGSLESVAFEIATASLWTEIPKLTNHLKSADFFSVREHPKAMFRSTSISAPDASGAVEITGDFTLIGDTREIKIPAAVEMTSKGLTLVSTFKLDRTEFGMSYGIGRVKKVVDLAVVIGAPTESGK